MPNRPICTACLRGLRQQFAECRPANTIHTRRPMSTGIRLQQQHKKSTSAATAPIPGTAQYQTPIPGPSVKHDGPIVQKDPQRTTANPSPTLAHKIRETAPAFTETYIAYGACETLVKECSRVAEYDIPEEQRKQQLIPDAERGVDIGVGKGWWYEQFHLTPNFNTWAQITLLHMWLLTVRLRQFPSAHAPAWHQHLTEHFFFLAEEKMATLHGISTRAVRNRYLKDLFLQWRGLTAGYDQGIYEGDAVVAAALWRNICAATEDVDLEKLAMVTSYVRSVLKGLEEITDEDLSRGEVVFEDPGAEAAVVRARSRLWEQPFAEEGEGKVKMG